MPVVPRTFRVRPLTAINYDETKGATQSYSLVMPVFLVSYTTVIRVQFNFSLRTPQKYGDTYLMKTCCKLLDSTQRLTKQKHVCVYTPLE